MVHCLKCDKNFANIRLHKDLVHRNKEESWCRKCGRLFSDGLDLQAHKTSICTEDKHQCYICSENYFESGKQFSAHLEEHSELHVYSCKNCPKTFMKAKAYEKHKYLFHDAQDPTKEFLTNEMEKSLAENWTPIKNENENLTSLTHCENCDYSYILIDAHNAFIHHSKPQHLCNLCGRHFTKSNHLLNHYAEHADNSIKCYVCHHKFDKWKGLCKHLENHSSLHIITCSSCPITFALIKNFKKHLKKKHSDDETAQDILIKLTNNSTGTLNFSSLSPIYKKPILEESNSITNNTQTVNHYNSSFEISQNIITPPDGSTNDETNSKKNKNNNRETLLDMSLADFEQKLKTNNVSDIDRTCFICHDKFNQLKYLYAHFIKEHNNGSLKCKICKKVFKMNYSVYFDRMAHANANPWKCQHCELTFTYKTFYHRHLKKVHFKTDCYKCTFCDESFIYYLPYVAHVANHENKKFKCNHCLKEFNYKKFLLTHIEDTQCELCDIILPCKTLFTEHLDDKHPFDSLFDCSYCDKQFCKPGGLRRHITMKHSDVEYKNILYCKLCDYFTHTRRNLTRHTTKYHS